MVPFLLSSASVLPSVFLEIGAFKLPIQHIATFDQRNTTISAAVVRSNSKFTRGVDKLVKYD